MICKKCKQDVPDGPYCCQCGAKQAQTARIPKSRGNGQGSVYRLPNGKYIARRVQYYLDADGVRHKRTNSKTFTRQKRRRGGAARCWTQTAALQSGRTKGQNYVAAAL